MSMQQAETPSRFGQSLPWPRSSTKRPPRLLHLFYRFQPGALFTIAIGLVVLALGLDFAPPVHDWLDRLARRHEVGISLSEHLLVAGLVAAAAYWWLLGHKRQQALKSYRRRARESPEELVEWSRGKPVVRDSMCKLLADGIRRSNETVVAIVQGRAGTGRTGFIVGLVRELAERDLIPVPVFAKRDGSFALEDLARETFWRHIDQVLSSEQQADAIWHRAKTTRDIVVLVDGLDDEVREALWRDDGQPFVQAVQSLRSRHIALVLATPGDLPRLDEMRPMREDLDVFNRDEAERYLEIALDQDDDATPVAVQALRRHSNPVDGGLIAPFYLDLLVRMTKSGISLDGLFTDRDRWRSEVLQRYLGAIGAGGNLRIVPESSADAEAPDPQTRALDAKDAAQKVVDELIKELAAGQPELTVARNRLETRDRAIFDAYDLHLLWRGNERVGFVGDDLGSYLLAARQSDFSKLLKGVGVVAESGEARERRDRHVLVALIFWHLQRPNEAQGAFEQLLETLIEKSWTRPAVVAAAIRTASACQLAGCSEQVAEATRRCIASLEPGASPKPWHASELPKVVRALSQWSDPKAHELLWDVAMHQRIEVDWAAAKALASEDGAATSLQSMIKDTLDRAKAYSHEELSDPDHEVGSRIGRLAWVLPALRGELEGQLATVKTFCLEPWMSPLRGEMSLAQGLKLAILKGKYVEENVLDVEELLKGSPRRVRFWHARLVLVHALVAYAWNRAEVGDQAEADKVKGQLRELLGSARHPLVRRGLERVHALLARIAKDRAWMRRVERRLGRFVGHERHPLVRRGIGLALAGLRTLDSEPRPHWSKYMWEHERDAVIWVEQGKEELVPLAADVVLLSNMTYRLREQKAPADNVNAAAKSEKLPRCILRSSERGRIEEVCDCGLELCTKKDAGNGNVPAVLATRAKFSENFCREQARLVAQNGLPQWTRREIRLRSKQDLQKFWDVQAGRIAEWESRAARRPAAGVKPSR